MLVRIKRSFKFGRRVYERGKVYELSSRQIEKLSDYVETLSEDEEIKYLVENAKFHIYIKEYRYLDKTLRDVLIISKEQLLRCLRDSKYGEVFRSYLRKIVFNTNSSEPNE